MQVNNLIILIIKVNAIVIILSWLKPECLQRTGAPKDKKCYCTLCVIRPRLTVITLQPRDGRRVLLISTDHIPLADWAINENVVIPQSAAQRPLVTDTHSPSSDLLIKFKGSPDMANCLFSSPSLYFSPLSFRATFYFSASIFGAFNEELLGSPHLMCQLLNKAQTAASLSIIQWLMGNNTNMKSCCNF